MDHSGSGLKRPANRRSFLKNGALGVGAAVGVGLLRNGSLAYAGQSENNGPAITKGDIAILTFLSALEQVEADL